MPPQQQAAYRHPCRHPLEMGHPRYQTRQYLDNVCYVTTLTIDRDTAAFPRQPVWHAQVTVVGPQGSLPLQALPAPVRQQLRRLAGQALRGVGTPVRHALETDRVVHLYKPRQNMVYVYADLIRLYRPPSYLEVRGHNSPFWTV